MRALLLPLLVLVLSGCASPIPFRTVTLGGQPTVTTDKRASLKHVTGAVRSVANVSTVVSSSMIMQSTSEPVPELQFNAADQAEFTDVLRSELLRLKVFRAVSTGEAAPASDVDIIVVFVQTWHQPFHQEYRLDVVLSVKGGKEPLLKRYRVNSNEDAPVFEKIGTSAYEGKIKAVRRLLERLMPDIQAYAAASASS